MARARIGIVNVTGYTGAELARLLYQHRSVSLTSVTGRSAAGQSLGQVFPHLAPLGLKVEEELGEVDLAFLALPHKASADQALPLLEKGVKVVDISADFRLREAAAYPEWYGFEHPAPELLAEAAYGLTELNREQVKRARLVANPGCYPTSAILALAPALKAGLIEHDIVVDSKSGVSGAGRALSLTTHFSEANESVAAYSLSGHRHLPEIVQELRSISRDSSLKVTFVPHLVPMTRGILSTCYARLRKDVDGDAARQIYKEFYAGEPFVRVTEQPPQTKQTWGSNLCLLYPTVDKRAERLVVVSCIDNLVKGAAGQAIQNMNLMLALLEEEGLAGLAVYP